MLLKTKKYLSIIAFVLLVVMVLPMYYNNHRDIAENFVYKFTPLLLEGKIDASVPTFNYMSSNEMLKRLETSLIKKGLLVKKL